MGGRKKPGDNGYRAEVPNPAVEANKAAAAKVAAGGKPQLAPATKTNPNLNNVKQNIPIPEGSVNLPPPQQKSEPFFSAPVPGVTSVETSNFDKFKNKVIGAAQQGKFGEGLQQSTGQMATVNVQNEDYTQNSAFVTPMGEAIDTSTNLIASGAISAGASSLLSAVLPASPGAIPGTQIQTLLTGQPGFIVNTAVDASIKTAATTAATTGGFGALGYSTFVAGAVAIISGKAFSKFIDEETIQAAGFVVKQAYDEGYWTGNWENYDLAIQTQEALLADDTFWESLKTFTGPFAAWDAVNKYRKTVASGLEIQKAMANNKKLQQQSGLTKEQISKVESQQESDDYKSNVDYYNSERKKLFDYEQAARTAANIAQTERERKYMEESAAFWAKEKEKQRELEAKDRIAIAQFWDSYKKQQQEINENSRPSALGFGLI